MRGKDSKICLQLSPYKIIIYSFMTHSQKNSNFCSENDFTSCWVYFSSPFLLLKYIGIKNSNHFIWYRTDDEEVRKRSMGLFSTIEDDTATDHFFETLLIPNFEQRKAFWSIYGLIPEAHPSPTSRITQRSFSSTKRHARNVSSFAYSGLKIDNTVLCFSGSSCKLLF